MGKLILKIVVVVLVVAALATGGIYAYNYFTDKSEEKVNGSGTTQVETNGYNKAIVERQLTTKNYSGTFKYKSVRNIEFNKYSESNKGGLTDEDIANLIANKGITGGVPAFNAYMDSLKNKEVYGEKDADGNVVTPGNNETLNIVTPDGSNYANFTNTVSTDASVKTGKVYGDSNLAVVYFDGSNSKIFLSLNYTTFADALSVNESNKAPQTSIIYVFEEVYSKTDSSLKLFTICYEYELIEEEPGHPVGDLVF